MGADLRNVALITDGRYSGGEHPCQVLTERCTLLVADIDPAASFTWIYRR